LQKYKGFLFDFDDTIYDHRHSSRSALNWLLNKFDGFGGTTLDELEQDNMKILEEIHLRQVLTGKVSLDDARAERFRRIFEKHGMTLDRNEMYEVGRHYRKEYELSRRLVPGARVLLQTIKGKAKIAVVTNNLVSEQLGKIRDCQIEEYIDELITSEETGFTKPEPQIFEVALKRINCYADEVVMIGDSWERDVVGAANLGIKNIWINIFNEPCPDKDLVWEFNSVIELNNSGLIKSLLQ
jgi:putative hydrolase of the HAD superfamily